MPRANKIDFAWLLGFETVTCELSEAVDFQDETLGAKLGAKVGGVEALAPERR
jgi:hypothetical protein